MKSKKILTILLSLAIMFTFMPAMAFATVTQSDGAQWDDENYFKTVTVGKTPYSTVREFSAGDNGTGILSAGIDTTAYDQSALPEVMPNTLYFYDLTNASLNIPDVVGKSYIENHFGVPANGKRYMTDAKLNIKAPTYAKDYVASMEAKNVDLDGWNITIELPSNYDPDAEKDQDITLTAVITCDGTANGTTIPYRADATVISKKVTVQGSLPSIDKVHFYENNVSTSEDNIIASPGFKTANNQLVQKWDVNSGLFDNATYVSQDNPNKEAARVVFKYNGSAHKLVSNTVNGFTVSWKVLNPTTGKYVAATECPEVTNVGDEKTVLACVSWSEDESFTDNGRVVTATVTYTQEFQFDLSVKGYSWTGLPTFGFDGNGDLAGGTGTISDPTVPGAKFGYSVAAGESYDATQWVVPEGLGTKDVKGIAVTANAEELKSFFNDFYTIKKTTKAAYPAYEFLTIVPKTDQDISAAELKTLVTKYATLLRNFGFDISTITSVSDLNLETTETYDANNNKTEYDQAYVWLKPATQDNEVEFTSAVSSKTYKGSKTTKKGKLKKTQSFTVKAVSNSGAAVSYKLVNANTPKIKINKSTGKITVKKGLAKGTYKFKVKAYVVGDKDAYEYQAITIKVKK